MEPNAPAGRPLAKRPEWTVDALLLGFLGVALAVQYGSRWMVAVPCGDEAHYLRLAFAAAERGEVAANPYLLVYQCAYALGLHDPFWAHTAMRVAVSAATTGLLYAFLRSGPWRLRRLAVLLCCLWWVRSSLNTPACQFATVNLFCLALVWPALLLVCRAPTFARCAGFAASLLLAALTRIEYLGPFALWTIVSVGLWARQGYPRSRWGLPQWAGALACASLGAALVVPYASGKRSYQGLDAYLLLGLNQGYAFLVTQNNPELAINPMQEYELITRDVFGTPATFTEACRNHPRAVLTYLAFNAGSNLSVFLPSLLEHRPIVPLVSTPRAHILESTVLVAGGLCGLLVAWRRKRRAPPTLVAASGGYAAALGTAFDAMFRTGLAAPLVLCATAVVPLLVLIADSRYWVACLPLVFLFLASGWDALWRRPGDPRWLWVGAALAGVLMLSPWPLPRAPGNGAAIRQLRRVPGIPREPLVAGSPPLAFYAFGTAVQAFPLERLTPAAIERREIDIIVVDNSLRQSATWGANAAFWYGFETRPGEHGYERIMGQPYGDGLYLYVRQATTVRDGN
jgi:hypothetical protein